MTTYWCECSPPTPLDAKAQVTTCAVCGGSVGTPAQLQPAALEAPATRYEIPRTVHARMGWGGARG